MLFSALVQISGYALFIWRIKLPSHVLQCSEIQITVRETLKLVLSLYNETLRQSPKPSHLKQDSLLAICRSVTSVHVLRRLRISVNSPFPVWTREIMPVNLSHVCNNLPNKPRESHSVTFLFLLMKESFSWGIKSTASACLFFFFFPVENLALSVFRIISACRVTLLTRGLSTGLCCWTKRAAFSSLRSCDRIQTGFSV